MTRDLPPGSPPLDTGEPLEPGETISDSYVPELEEATDKVQERLGKIARKRGAPSSKG